MADLDVIKDVLPEFGNISASSIIGVFAWFILFIIVAVIIAVIAFIIIRNMKFRYKIWIFDKVSGRTELVAMDRARVTRLGESGDTILYLRKMKKYIPTPSIQTGRNTYFFYIREDREWINIGIEDIDLKMREVKANFLDKEMRYARAALQKNLKDRYNKITFMEKYGSYIAYVGLIVVIGIMTYLLFDKFIELSGSINAAMDKVPEVLEQLKGCISASSNVCGGGGLQPA